MKGERGLGRDIMLQRPLVKAVICSCFLSVIFISLRALRVGSNPGLVIEADMVADRITSLGRELVLNPPRGKLFTFIL